ncbi:MAG: carboxypeptidase regulatory-like domain-containing protein [Chloroflexi bacterium]|nr:carboxypeptidase regulatory-like domain-containing protein [Chloroflexota bacterium]
MPKYITWVLVAIAWVGLVSGSAAREALPPSMWIVRLHCEDGCASYVREVRARLEPREDLGRVNVLSHPGYPEILFLVGADDAAARRLSALPFVEDVRPAAPARPQEGALETYRIAGQVVSQSGAPIANAWVSATEFRTGSLASGLSDPSGAFSLQVNLPGDWLVVAQQLFDHGFADPVWVHVPPEVTDVRLVVRENDRLITGVVRDADGKPVSNASVAAEALRCAEGNIYRAYTDETGSYQFSVPAGEYEVSVETLPQPLARRVDLREAQTATLNFQMPAAYRVTGRVIGDGDQPVWKSRVRARPMSACRDVDRWADRDETDGGGNYALSLGGISYWVRATWPGDAIYGVVTTTISPQADVAGLDLRLPEVYPVRGNVRTHSGGSLSGAFDVVALTPGGEEVAHTRPDSSGAFTFTLMAGRYSLASVIQGYPDPAPVVVDVAGPVTDVELRAPEAFQVTGRVLDRSGGPLTGATVMAQPVGTGEAESTPLKSDASGAYTLTVPAGVYELRAVADVPFPSQVVTVTQDISGIDFTYPTTYRVSGVVRDASGQPITQGMVYYVVPGQYSGHEYVQSKLIYYDGSFAFDLPAGTYEVEVEACGYASARRQVTVPPDASLTLTLDPLSQRIRGRVTLVGGAPACGVPVVAQAGDVSYETETLADRVYGWGAGAYELRVGPGSYLVRPASKRYPSSTPPQRRVTVPPDVTHADFVIHGLLSQRVYLPILLRDGK